MPSTIKHALVLSGGGFKGAFQVGALNYLSEHWQQIDPSGGPMGFEIVSGISAGALNGAMVAAGKLDVLNNLWDDVAQKGAAEIYTSEFIDTRADAERLKFRLDFPELLNRLFPGIRLNLVEKLHLAASRRHRAKRLAELREALLGIRAIADNSPLARKLDQHIKISDISDGKFLCGFVSLDDGKYHSVVHDEFDSDSDFRRGILASTAIPIVWEPIGQVDIAGKERPLRNLVDGGVRNLSPLGDVIAHINRDDTPDCEYVVIIINNNSGEIEQEDHSDTNVIGIALRALVDITLNEIFLSDLRHFLTINDLVEQAKAHDPPMDLFKYDFETARRTNRRLRSFKAIVINPEPGVLGDSLVANCRLIEQRLEHGRAKAREAISMFRQKGLDPDVVV